MKKKQRSRADRRRCVRFELLRGLAAVLDFTVPAPVLDLSVRGVGVVGASVPLPTGGLYRARVATPSVVIPVRVRVRHVTGDVPAGSLRMGLEFVDPDAAALEQLEQIPLLRGQQG